MTTRDKLAEALHEAEHGLCACDYLDQTYLDQADDLLPWLTQHDAELLSEVEHWKSHAEEAGAGFAEVCKTSARVSARNHVLARERDDVFAELNAARAEVESARAVLARVTCTVCDELLMPFEESLLDESVETADRWAHRDCMEAGE